MRPATPGEPRLRDRLRSRILGGRLPEERAWPAGVEGIEVRWLRLPRGVRVRTAQAGAADAPPVVMLAGWGASLYMYRRNILPLAAAGFRAIAVDLEGQGQSDKPADPGEYTLPSLTRHVLELLDALELPRAALVAQSLAGAVAVEAALRAPDRVDRLGLVSPVGFGRIRLIQALSRSAGAFSQVAPYLASRWTFERAIRLAYGWRAEPTERDIDEYWAPSRDPMFVRSLFHLLRQMPWELLPEEVLRRIPSPVLLVFGTDDRVVSPRDCERLAAMVPDARVLMIPGGGHASLEIAPEVVNPALVEFLRASPRTAPRA